MKAPKPAIPECAPPGTVWFGGPIEWFSITLRITCEDLVPDDVTKLMGCKPDESQQKGKPVLREDGTVMRIAPVGLVADVCDTREELFDLAVEGAAAAAAARPLRRVELGAQPRAFRLDGGDDSAERFGGCQAGSVELLFL